MASTDTINSRQRARQESLKQWAAEHAVDLADLDDGQRWVIFAALRFLAFAGPVPDAELGLT